MSEKLVAGEVAIDVARQVSEPMRALRDRLGLVVDHLERHVATSTGPTPYPWRSLQSLRQDLSSAYLEVTQLARRLEELDQALQPAEPQPFDLAAAVDLGLRLAGHHFGPGVELLFDLGAVPPARGIPGTASLIVAQLVAVCAGSARGVASSSLTVRVWADEAWDVITIADNGGGDPHALELGEVARAILTSWGGSVDAASEPGKGCAFELRLVNA